MIDAVIAWVDGADPAHADKRHRYLSEVSELSAGADNPLRWQNNDEISVCVRSIELYAPWIRKVWIVTDNQVPHLTGISDGFRQRIEIVDHTKIFQEYSDVLPVFNSLSIESVLFRIPGLADKFIYFNDDSFLTRATVPSDFFTRDGMPVLRGSWVDSKKFSEPDFLIPHRKYQYNAARMVLGNPDRVFLPAHVAHTLCRRRMEYLFDQFRAEFERNLAFRFRDDSQFNMVSLCASSAIAAQDCVMLSGSKDFHQVTAGTIQRGNIRRVNGSFRSLMKRRVKLGCINDVGKLNSRFPGMFEHFRATYSASLPRRLWARLTLGRKRNYARTRSVTWSPVNGSVTK